MTDDGSKEDRKFTLRVALIGALAGVAAAAIGGAISFATTVYVQHSQNASNQAQDMDARTASLVAVVDEIRKTYYTDKPSDSTTKQAFNLEATMDSDYLNLLLSATEPISSDADKLFSDATSLAMSVTNGPSTQGVQYADDTIADISKLEKAVNPSLANDPTAPS